MLSDHSGANYHTFIDQDPDDNTPNQNRRSSSSPHSFGSSHSNLNLHSTSHHPMSFDNTHSRKQSHSISGKDSIPPSMQVLHQQKSIRHRDEYVAEIIEMGFSQHQAELAYEAMEEEHGIKNFNVEQCVEYIVNNFSEMSKVSLTLENDPNGPDIIPEESLSNERVPLHNRHSHQSNIDEEKEEELSQPIQNTPGITAGLDEDEVELEVAVSPSPLDKKHVLAAVDAMDEDFYPLRPSMDEEKQDSIDPMKLTPGEEINEVEVEIIVEEKEQHQLTTPKYRANPGLSTTSNISSHQSSLPYVPHSDMGESSAPSISISINSQRDQLVQHHSDHLQDQEEIDERDVGMSLAYEPPKPVDLHTETHVEAFDDNSRLPEFQVESKFVEEDVDDYGPKKTCIICTDEKSMNRFFRRDCGHEYCHDCIRTYFETCIKDGVVEFSCMDPDCETEIPEKEVRSFITLLFQAKLDRFKRNVELAGDPNVRWCIRPGCDTPLRRRNNKEKKLVCTNPNCTMEICYNCSGAWHEGRACDTVLDEKLNQWCDSGQRDVQICPRCNARIEKLEGCNHMKCSVCKYEFCWLCRKEYKKGHYDPKNILFGCPGGERADAIPSKCGACCQLVSACCLMSILPVRVCWWRMKERGFPGCCFACCCCCPCCD